MPIADFPGRRNWGYDGVLPFAPDAAYGRPDDLKAFIDTAHLASACRCFWMSSTTTTARWGIASPAYAPIFTDKHETPWGAAVNYDDDGSDEVRDFVIENVLYWLGEIRFDGLRFDAANHIMAHPGRAVDAA